MWLWLSISVNLGFLAVFKYFNFFAQSFSDVLAQGGVQTNFWTLKVILPVGISFYTFHGLSYIIDVYKERIKPEKNFIEYALFVSFFPLLVAGPIERATHLLPQLKARRTFNYLQAVDGLRQMLWGFFKKLVIADNCAIYANQVFNNSGAYNGSTHVLGAFYFAVQIYADFSGYSDIALGTAKLFGINLLRNFSFPYFSRDIAEFWRNWHISLTTWFKDYVYIPLGGSRGSTAIQVRNVFIVFLLSGFWHGANLTFIAWGALNAIYFLPLLLLNKNRTHIDPIAKGKILPGFKEVLQMLFTFALVCFAWIFFRSQSLTGAFDYIKLMFSKSIIARPQNLNLLVCLHICLFFAVEWFGREQKYAIEKIAVSWPRILRWCFYSFIIFDIGMYMATQETPFIYFQF